MAQQPHFVCPAYRDQNGGDYIRICRCLREGRPVRPNGLAPDATPTDPDHTTLQSERLHAASTRSRPRKMAFQTRQARQQRFVPAHREPAKGTYAR